jgi:hypothetical protein
VTREAIDISVGQSGYMAADFRFGRVPKLGQEEKMGRIPGGEVPTKPRLLSFEPDRPFRKPILPNVAGGGILEARVNLQSEKKNPCVDALEEQQPLRNIEPGRICAVGP